MTEPRTLPVSDRSRLRRKRERGSHDRRVIDAVLDEGLVCHVGFQADGTTFVVPCAYARSGDVVYLHGAVANHMLGALSGGSPACITVTLVDGLVLARSAKHHSVNFRSVMLFGSARLVTDDHEKRAALAAVVEHIVPGRSADARPPSDEELRATKVLAFPIEEGSAKVRTGGPIEDPADLELAVWAGEVPLRLVAGEPIADDGIPSSLPEPAYLRDARFAAAEAKPVV
jgi:nitroimidazol reductase NimA-like FMN-containing flavoprotein (pyridoxamine 5'-phosphate oxidase superfamily)